jgi:hypothetical protein
VAGVVPEAHDDRLHAPAGQEVKPAASCESRRRRGDGSAMHTSAHNPSISTVASGSVASCWRIASHALAASV